MQARDVQTFVEQSYLKTRERSDVGSYQLDRGLSHDRAAIYFDPQANSVVVVNRGTTATLQDWSNNYMLATGQYNETERMQNALDTQHAVRAKYHNAKITNIAHSQSQAIVTNLNDRGLTDQVITLNGATTPWDTQQKNETRVRSELDVVSAAQLLAPSRKRNHTIKAKTWSPLDEHSANILERMNPVTIFGKGVVKTYYY